MTDAPSESPLQFPCEFPIKAFGPGSDDFDAKVTAIVRRHAPDLAEAAVASRASKGGKYQAVTVTITARSQAQLDAIYRDLTADPAVLMAM
jgi:putative lipoic acid-binding regulatory protein